MIRLRSILTSHFLDTALTAGMSRCFTVAAADDDDDDDDDDGGGC